MEDVLEVYQRPYDGNEVLVCMDETSKQQVKETRVPRPAAPGLSAAYDYEYERNGVSSLFMLFAPLDGWRRVEVRERRTKVDWAHVIKKLVDEDYPDRDRIVLVMDNLGHSRSGRGRRTRDSSLQRRGVESERMGIQLPGAQTLRLTAPPCRTSQCYHNGQDD